VLEARQVPLTLSVGQIPVGVIAVVLHREGSVLVVVKSGVISGWGVERELKKSLSLSRSRRIKREERCVRSQ